MRWRASAACEQASADLGASPRPARARHLAADAAGRDIRRHHRLHAGGLSAYVTPALLSGASRCCPMLIFQQYAAVFDFHLAAAR